MPLPFLLLGAAAALVGVGIKKGADAISDNRRASELQDRAERIFDEAKEALEEAKIETTRTLEQLGELKVQVWGDQLTRFVALMQRVRHVDFHDKRQIDPRLAAWSSRELGEMRQVSLKMSEIAVGGLGALGSGALVGIASYGGAMMLASASTGTAISALSGAAATNATLAWFGGGSLAAGGLGMAGGAAILGGIVAAPVLAVGGIYFAAKARENLAQARKVKAQAEQAAEEMSTATSRVHAIGTLAELVGEAVTEAASRLDALLPHLQAAIESCLPRLTFWERLRAQLFGWRPNRADYRRMTLQEQQTVFVTVQMADLLKQLVERPVLTKDGVADEETEAFVEQVVPMLEAG